jgi:hypothetical protein
MGFRDTAMIEFQMPTFRQRANRLQQAVQGPKFSGRSRHGAPDRHIQKMPLRTRRSSTVGTSRFLFGSNGLAAIHS